jgi:hypothetical protein
MNSYLFFEESGRREIPYGMGFLLYVIKRQGQKYKINRGIKEGENVQVTENI